MANYGFGAGGTRFRFSPDDDPTKGYIPQPRQQDPTVVSQNENLLPDVPKTSQPSMLDTYKEIMANRPQRTALQQTMENAPQREDYKPNKMTRLGAILGGVSAGFRDPGKGMELAQSTLDRPYNEATEGHEKRLRDLTALAAMEGQDVQTMLQGVGAEESRRQHEQTFGENVRQSNRAFGENVRQADRSFGLNEKEYNLKGFRDYKRADTGHSGVRNIISGQEIDFGKTDLTPGEETKNKAGLYNQTIGASNLADIKSRENIAGMTTDRAIKVANIKANNARIIAEMSIGADEAVKQMNTELSNQLTNPESALFNIDLDEYTVIGPTGTRIFKPGMKENKNNAAIVGALGRFLQIDPKQGKGARPNPEAQSILDEWKRQNPPVPTPTPRVK